MIDIIQSVGFGLLSGVLTGMMPGIGIMLGFLLFLPLIPLDPLCILLYGIVLKVGSQFFGSMAVLYLKIPGESSSMPVMLELKHLKIEDTYRAVMLTNFGSLVASIFSTLILFWFLQAEFAKGIYFPIELKTVVFLILILIATFTNKNIVTNFCILLFGAFINFYAEIAAEIKTYIDVIPIYYFNTQLILIIIFVSQLLWVNVPLPANVDVYQLKKEGIGIKKYLGKISIYSILGCICGLIPQLGSTISSYLSYSIEKFRKKSPLDKITASETANNGAAVTGWLPLLLFGIPFNGSEIMMLQHFETYNLDLEFLKSENIPLIIMYTLMIVGVLYFVMASYVNQKYYVLLGQVICKRWFSWLLLLISLGSFWLASSYDLTYVIIHLVIFLPVSYYFYRINADLLSLIIGLLLMDEIVYNFIRVIQIYS
jgi:putative tricarboxylic transport membrane protein